MNELSAPAPAKLNLTLEIAGKRDDGFHELRSVMQTLELADLVTIRSGVAGGVAVDGPFADGVPTDETNLAWRAAHELARRTGNGIDQLRITLTKRIPPAGGLGGGASNAATTLRLLQRLWAVHDEQALQESANAVGSDEAFFLMGGTALVSGRGDVVEAVTQMERSGVVLYIPFATLERKTAVLFSRLAGQRFDDGHHSQGVVTALPRRPAGEELFNGFERVAFDAFAGLAALRDEIEAVIGEPVHLAGAGPTLYWLGDAERAEDIARRTMAAECHVVLTATAGPLWKQ